VRPAKGQEPLRFLKIGFQDKIGQMDLRNRDLHVSFDLLKSLQVGDESVKVRAPSNPVMGRGGGTGQADAQDVQFNIDRFLQGLFREKPPVGGKTDAVPRV
jgi:hypothetical protein